MKKTTGNILVIFGATGDLASRKIFPALNEIKKSDKLPENFHILGCGRKELIGNVFAKLSKDLINKSKYFKLDPNEEKDYNLLTHNIDRFKNKYSNVNVIYYLSTPPDAYKPIVNSLIKNKLNLESSGYRRIIIEKPFGKDLKTSKKLNKILVNGFEEKQIFRIDHYLGKETVQNILVSRFTNLIFNALWNKDFISYIEITAAESIGIKGRGEYYDTTGAIKDMFQNHLLELLCLVAMDEPKDSSSESIRNQKINVLNKIRKINFKEDIIRGQYTSSNTKTKKFKNYPTPFSNKENAKDAFDKLFDKYKKSIILVSYSSNCLPTLDEMVEMLAKYKKDVKVLSIDYRYSFANQKENMSTNKNMVKEYLFLGF